MAIFRSSLGEMRQELAQLEAALTQLPAYLPTVKDAQTFSAMKRVATKLIHCFLGLPDEEFFVSARAPYSHDDTRPTYNVIVEQATRLLTQTQGKTAWEKFLERNGLSEA